MQQQSQTNMTSIYATTPAATQMENANQPLSLQETARRCLRTLEERAEALQHEFDMKILNDNVDEELSVKLDKAWDTYKKYKLNAASRYPLDAAFSEQVPKGTDSVVPKALRFGEMPCLMAYREKAREPHGEVYHNVKDFVTHLEDYCLGQSLDLNLMHSKCLPLLLGKSYKSYVTTMTESVGGVENVSWPMIKQWLFEFVDTPKQRIKNIKAVANLTPNDGETAESFSSRMLNVWDSVDMTKVTVAEYTMMLQMLNMPMTWSQRMAEAINNAPEEFKKKTYPEMVALFNSLDLRPDSKKRKQEAFSFASGKKSKNMSFSAMNGNKTFHLPLCQKGCGQRYTPGHNETCPNKPKGKFENKKFSRAAVRTQAQQDAESITDLLLEPMEIFDDKLECKKHYKKKEENLSRLEGEVNVPIYIENIPVLAFVDTGANFSSLNKAFCLQNKIPIFKHTNSSQEEIMLANANTVARSYGHTAKLELKYNDNLYTFRFDVMDLMFDKPMSIGTDLMKLLGIGITGLAISWDVPNREEEESPFKDVPEPNEDPFGSKEDRQFFHNFISESLKANEKIPTNTFCTHPDAVVYLDTPDDAAGYRSQYPIADTLKPKVQETVEKWLRDGVITEVPSNVDNKWNSPLTLAPKKDSSGNYTDKRPCLDPRHINKYLKEDKFPLPKINEIFKKLQGANVFTTLDLTNAFHRFPINEPDQHKTAFTSVDGKQYMFKGCPFGLKPISSKFQRVMSKLFTKATFKNFVSTFVDDIVIYSKDMEEHAKHTKMVIDELTSVNLILNPKKCHFAQKTIYLLGFCVSTNGCTYLDPRKVTNTMDWPTPRTGKDIQRFLGLVNYFRDYIPKISVLTAPLNGLRNVPGKLGDLWTHKQNEAFENIKEALAHSPVLQPPNLDMPFHVATDASDVGIGAVLYQVDQDKKINHIGFMARSLSKSERNYGTTKRELLAIVFALNKFHQYLWGRHFTLHTDHKALVYIHTQKGLNAMLNKWLDTLLDYDFTIEHLPGMDNVLPDSLSRLFPVAKELVGGNLDKVKSSGYLSKEKVTRAASIAYLKENKMEPPTEKEKQELLEKAHLFGHFGAEAIVKAIHNNGVHWPKMIDQAIALVKACPQCQKFNIVKTGYNPHRPVHAKLPGDHWAIDLAGPLPTTDRKNKYLLVMIDICTRFVILRPLQDKTAESVVQALIPVFCDFGIPRIVQSDNGKEFANQVMQRFKQKAGFDHRLITPYYPQSNGAAERTVGTVMNAIKKVVEGASSEWDLYIYSVQLAVNSKVSKRLNTPPFNIMFGRKLNDFKKYDSKSDKMNNLTQKEVNERLKELQEVIFPAFEEKTQQAINVQKSKFDKKHAQRDLPEGSYVRLMVKPNFRSKMDPIYEGPYKVVRKTQAGTYVLKDTTGENMPKSYPVSQLKPVIEKAGNEKVTFEVEAIVAHKTDPKTNKYIYRVKWLEYDSTYNTWEPAENFYSQKVIEEYWNKIREVPEDTQVKRSLKRKYQTRGQTNKRTRGSKKK